MHAVINVNVVYHNVQLTMENCQIFLIDLCVCVCVCIYIYKVEYILTDSTLYI